MSDRMRDLPQQRFDERLERDKQEQTRIMLAEAMGLRRWTCNCDWSAEATFEPRIDCPNCGEPLREVSFDPFTDANDDYAVLEWMRSNSKYREAWIEFKNALAVSNAFKCNYKIGDYARAAITVLREQRPAPLK